MFKTEDREKFWSEYGERIGEEVLAYSMGRYIKGWPGERGPIWGLLIASKGGLRFHHIPRNNWLDSLLRGGTATAPQEKTFFAPSDRLLSVEVWREKSRLKQIFAYQPPRLIVRFLDEDGDEREFIAEGDGKLEALAGKLVCRAAG